MTYPADEGTFTCSVSRSRLALGPN
jgi:hypothetical protein